jgi:putative NIF3 family GTP cyclohydrolase 1 type 2
MHQRKHNRRAFLKASALSMGLAGLKPALTERGGSPVHPSFSLDTALQSSSPAITVQQVIDLIIQKTAGRQVKETVDTVKAGMASQHVSGIVVTFLATCRVIEAANQLGANLVITHEPVFYNHLDQVTWLKEDPVYLAKRRLIDDHRMAIWRCHDYWHLHRPDGIMAGVLKELGWEPFADFKELNLCTIHPMPLVKLVSFFKDKLQLNRVEFVGDPAMSCQRVAFLPGSAGGREQILLLARTGVEVLVCGEINEWETCEYARDAVRMGRKKALITLGHASSEEPGMRWMAQWLQPFLPGVKITHIPAGDPFRVSA